MEVNLINVKRYVLNMATINKFVWKSVFQVFALKKLYSNIKYNLAKFIMNSFKEILDRVIFKLQLCSEQPGT